MSSVIKYCEDVMKCLIINMCENKFLCCHFCDVKRCKERCHDKHKNCKYFEKEKITRVSTENKYKSEEV